MEDCSQLAQQRRLGLPLRAPRIALFVAFVCLGVAAPAIYRDAHQRPAPLLLQVDPGDLNLGTVWQQPSLRFSVPIKNVSGAVIAVDRFSSSCNCTHVEPDSFSVAPGRAVVVTGTIDLLDALESTTLNEVPFSVNLTAEIGGGHGEKVSWLVHGHVRRILHMSPSTIELVGANEIAQGCETRPVTVRMVPQTDVATITPEWSRSDADVEVTGPLEGGEFVLRYTPHSDRPKGEFHSHVRLRTRSRDGRINAAIDIPVHGSVVAPVRLSPSRVVIPYSSKPYRSFVSAVSRDHDRWSLRLTSPPPQWANIAVLPTGGLQINRLQDVDNLETVVVELTAKAGGGRTEDLTLEIIAIGDVLRQ